MDTYFSDASSAGRKPHWVAPALPNLRAVVAQSLRPWPSPSVMKRGFDSPTQNQALVAIGTDNEHFVCSGPARDETGVAAVDYPPSFWRSLLDDGWAARFEAPLENRMAIEGFYRLYGPLTEAGAAYGCESLEAARLVIEWLRHLELLAGWLTAERYVKLIEYLGQLREGSESYVLFAAEIPGIPNPERLSISLSVTDPTSCASSELASAGWTGILEAVSGRLACTPLVPVKSEFTPGRQPFVVWGFRPRAGIDVAFLQWFFERLGYDGDLPRCEGCGNPVLPPRENWCSDRCRERVYKRRQRERKRKLRDLPERTTPAEEYGEWERPEARAGQDVAFGNRLSQQLAQALPSALSELDSVERQVIELRYVDGLTHLEISQRLAANKDRVQEIVDIERRALAHLRGRLIKEDGDGRSAELD